MFKIVSKEQFSEKVFRLRVEAPLIAKAYRAGNFVILRIGEKGERIPLTICDYDSEKGIITIVFQPTGESTLKMSEIFILHSNEGQQKLILYKNLRSNALSKFSVILVVAIRIPDRVSIS